MSPSKNLETFSITKQREEQNGFWNCCAVSFCTGKLFLLNDGYLRDMRWVSEHETLFCRYTCTIVLIIILYAYFLCVGSLVKITGM
jgi:hypothetical protein